jgi:hypothetical protein
VLKAAFFSPADCHSPPHVCVFLWQLFIYSMAKDYRFFVAKNSVYLWWFTHGLYCCYESCIRQSGWEEIIHKYLYAIYRELCLVECWRRLIINMAALQYSSLSLSSATKYEINLSNTQRILPIFL